MASGPWPSLLVLQLTACRRARGLQQRRSADGATRAASAVRRQCLGGQHRRYDRSARRGAARRAANHGPSLPRPAAFPSRAHARTSLIAKRMRYCGIDMRRRAVTRCRDRVVASRWALLTRKFFRVAVGSHPKQKVDPLRAKGPLWRKVSSALLQVNCIKQRHGALLT